MSSNVNKRANKLTGCALPRAGKASCDLNMLLHILSSLWTKWDRMVTDDPISASFPRSSLLAQMKIRDAAKISSDAQSPSAQK